MDKREFNILIENGMNFEGVVLCSVQKQIRELSKSAYLPAQIDARMILLAVGYRLFMIRNGVAGKASPATEERLALVTAFHQGVGFTETLISEGQYIKASAALRQDYEIVARLREILENSERTYGTHAPNIKYAPRGSQKIYSQLSEVVHITQHSVLLSLLRSHEEGDARGLSAIPSFNRDTAIALYDVHVFTIAEVTREHFILMQELYGEDILKELFGEAQLLLSVLDRLAAEAGWQAIERG